MRAYNRRQFLKAAGSAALTASMVWASHPVFGLHPSHANDQLLMDPSVLSGRLEDLSLRILDIRSDDNYLSGHLPGAPQLWYPQVTVDVDGVPGLVAPPETVADVMSANGIDADTEVVVYGDTGAIWAARMFWVLDYHGHANVRVLDGGYPFWFESVLPISLGRVDAPQKAFEANVQPQKRVDADWVLDHLNDPDVVFVDARDADAYSQGHIPGAVSKTWRDNIDWDTERFKPLETLESRFTDDGIVKELTVVSYCQTGVLSAQNYFTFRLLGYPDVRLYDGSFADWSHDPQRPIEKQAD